VGGGGGVGWEGLDEEWIGEEGEKKKAASDWSVQAALMGGFCVGIGVGVLLGGSVDDACRR